MISKAPLWKVFLCTFGMIGVHFTWTLELAYGTPYLLSLNLSRELTALVWLAGPLSGIIVQPVIGAISDNSTFRLGKRRPFIVIGGLIVLASLLSIAFSQDLASLFADSDPNSTRYWTIVIVIISFYTLDFSLNAVQASCRSLVVDTFCVEQQDTANAFASNLGNISNVFGYFMGYTDLTKHLPSLIGGGISQIKALFVMGVIVFGVSVSVTCIFTNEKRLTRKSVEVASSPNNDRSLLGWCRHSVQTIISTVKYIWRSGKNLPTPIKRLCHVQFFSWMGWFPILFYSTTWVSGLYYQEHSPERSMINDNWEDGARAGSFALLIYATVSVVSGTILPWITTRGYASLKTVFTCSHLIFAVVIFCSHWIQTVEVATIVIGIIGICWSCTMWIPYVLTAEYIYNCNNTSKSNKSNSNKDYGSSSSSDSSVRASGSGGERSGSDAERKSFSSGRRSWNTGGNDDNNNDIHSTRLNSTLKSSPSTTPTTTDIIMTPDQQTTTDTFDIENNNTISTISSDPANVGIAFGIMNMFAALPQFVVALIAYVFFAIRQSQSPFDSGPNSDVAGVAWLLVFGSWMALIAAGLSRRLLDV